MTAPDDSGGGCFLWVLLAALLTLFAGVQIPDLLPPTPESAAEFALELVLAPADTSAADADIKAAADVLGARLTALQSEGHIIGWEVRQPDARSIIVHLSAGGEMPADEIVTILLERGLLELADFSSIDPATAFAYVGTQVMTSALAERQGIPFDPATMYATIVTNADFAALSYSQSDTDMENAVLVSLTPEGAEIMQEFSRAHIGDALAIVLNGEVLSVPIIQAELSDQLVLTGADEAQTTRILNFASAPYLPIDLVLVRITTTAP